ncbi:retrotransposon protein, putative, ty3-gypsy subclass [Tanacetum coccineum]
MAESAKRHEENSNIIKEIRASTDATIRNQGASIKTLEIQIGQMSKVLQERRLGSLPSSTETNPRDQVKSISIAKADFLGYAVSDVVHTPEAQDVKILYAYDHTLPQKEKDPRSFTLPCFIHNICFDKALVNLGASFTIIDDDDMTKDVVLGMKFCKKYPSCQSIMKKFVSGIIASKSLRKNERRRKKDLAETMICLVGVVGRGGRGRGPRKGGAPDFSTIIAQQLQNLLPAILAQVGNQENVGNQNGNVVNENVQENVRNVLVNSNRDMSGCSIDQKVKYTAGSFVGKDLTWWNSQIRTLSREVAVSMSWNDFKFMMIEEFCPSHEMQKLETKLWNHVMVGAGHAAYTYRFYELASALTDEAVRNGSIKKVEKRENVAEPSKDKNGRDDNKRTRTRNTFATIANPIRRENTGAWPKCTTCNSYHAPGGPCRTCFNCNRPGHLAKDCRSVPRNVNPVNARNQTARACYECSSTNHVRSACPRLNKAQGPEGNRPNQITANNRGQGHRNQRNHARGRAFMLGA